MRQALLFGLVVAVGCTSSKPKDAPAPAPEAPAEAPAPAPAPVPEPAAEPEKPKPARAGAARPEAPYPLKALTAVTADTEIQELLVKLGKSGGSKRIRKSFEAKGKAGKEALMNALRATDSNIRAQSATVMNRMNIKSRRFSQALDEMLLSDPDPDVRGIAGRVLVYYQRHKMRHNTAALIEALQKDTTEAVRMHAAWALGASHDKKGTQALIKALDDEFTDVRLRTVGALKRIKAGKAAPHVALRLEDTNTLVRERAHDALKALTGKDWGPDAKRWQKAYPVRN
ncbi:MAG: hypothetical protein ACI9WU_000255 [Myxococcota bacterium]|jgi:hypothetical protein